MTDPAPSYMHGASDQPMIGDTIGVHFDRTVARFADRPGLICRQQGINWTWSQLAAHVDAFAAGLIALGLQPGDRIGIWAPNNAEWIVTQYATAKAGIILVNINPAYRLTEVEYALNKVGCKALVTATSFKTSDYIGMINTLAPELATSHPGNLQAQKLPALRSVIQIGGNAPGTFAFDKIAHHGRDTDRQRLKDLAPSLHFDDPINIQFHNILNNGFFIGEMMHYTDRDLVCVPVPMYHCFGMVIGSLACMTHGAAIVFPGEGFDPLATLQTVAEHRCTSLYGVPTMFIAELDPPDFSKYDLTSLRTGMMAGSPCPTEVMRRCIRDMHLTEITIGYGMTETSPVSTQTRIGDTLEKQVATVGRPHPHVEVKIIDTEGRVVPRGVTGEFCTRGYPVMLGYWDEPGMTAEAIDRAGWMHTGDLATMDEDGYCAIVGRIKDLVIRGGENIYPREVEEFLYRHPAIVDVQVFGVPDKRFGEELCAWVKLRAGETLTEDDIKAFCKDQIAHYKVPRYVRFVEEFPMTVTGKMQKYLMRATMTEELQSH
jgi:fatty-acyl-CoA synthase